VNFKFPGFGQRPLRPIVIAAGAGEPEEVERLLGLGADPNWVASDGSTALIRCLQTCEQTEGAARERAVAAAHRLLEEDLTASINARTHESRVTALGSAVAAGLPDLVRWVLAQGASVDGHHGMEDASPLYWSIQQWALGLLTVDGMSTLLKEEAQWGPGGVEAALRVPGLPPLFADAARRLRAGAPQTEAYAVIAPVLLKRQRDRADAFIESAYLLLDHGASPNAAAASSFTPLLSGLQMYARRAHWMGWDMARRRVLLDLIEGMVAAGGDLNGAGPTGESGWSYAHEANDPELLLRIVPPLST
jgi:ankyrin repeat protein